MGEREILETYSNSASKNTSERDILPHGPKSLLTSVIAETGGNYSYADGSGSSLYVVVMGDVEEMT